MTLGSPAEPNVSAGSLEVEGGEPSQTFETLCLKGHHYKKERGEKFCKSYIW